MLKPPKGSIAGLMILVALAAGASALVRASSDGWIHLLRFLTVGALVGAALRARHQAGAGSAFAFGFAIFGAATYVLWITEWSDHALDDPPLMKLAARLTEAFDTTSPNSFESVANTHRRVQVVQMLGTLTVGLLGGMFLGWRDQKKPVPDTVPGLESFG